MKNNLQKLFIGKVIKLKKRMLGINLNSKPRHMFMLIDPSFFSYAQVTAYIGSKVFVAEGKSAIKIIFVGNVPISYNPPTFVSLLVGKLPDKLRERLHRKKVINPYGLGVWMPSWLDFNTDSYVVISPPVKHSAKVISCIEERLNTKNFNTRVPYTEKLNNFADEQNITFSDLGPDRTIN